MNPDKLQSPTIKSHLAFTLVSALALLVIYGLLRLALLMYNHELIGNTPINEFLEAFYLLKKDLSLLFLKYLKQKFHLRLLVLYLQLILGLKFCHSSISPLRELLN